MSRIRSVHPGLWTDEEFVGLSAFARLLFMGLWNECDDKGTFEWKPLTIKMRLLPADNLDINELLDEIETAGSIRRYEIAGKVYGAVRNFGKFQRPKKPNDIHPKTPEILEFCCVSSETVDDEKPSVPNRFPTGGEIAPQMEDGGGNRRGEKEKAYAFSGRVARLKKSDFDDWERRFHAIPDFQAELATLDNWLTEQPAEKQKKWFATGSAWLNRRHQEALERAKPSRAEWAFTGPC